MPNRRIRISLCSQRLVLFEGTQTLESYQVSTAAKGAGEQDGSEQTPRGHHEVRAKIGKGAPRGAVFESRRPTGEICDANLLESAPDRDWILSRILWLRGLERGRNRGRGVDTMRRYIYIHGTPHEATLGTPASHGCIRMSNEDVMELFELVEVGTSVEIVP